MSTVTLHHADALEVLAALPDASVHAVVTDPPYGLSNTTPVQVAETLARWAGGERGYVPAGKGFMGKSWDGFVPPPALWDEVVRVLKPGGHVLCFAGARTQDLMGISMRMAGLDIRDSLMWVFGTGFPKSMDVSKAIDKAAGATRPVVGVSAHSANRAPVAGYGGTVTRAGGDLPAEAQRTVTGPATAAAAAWEGWGTALKPAHEPILLARKPLEGTVVANLAAHGVGALNIDATRVGTTETLQGSTVRDDIRGGAFAAGHTANPGDIPAYTQNPAGRFPANVILDEHTGPLLDAQSGTSKSPKQTRTSTRTVDANHTYGKGLKDQGASFGIEGYADEGGASRFFYCAKASKAERPVVNGITHPTQKPRELMRWLIRLVCPPGSVVLEPFAGSGTTVEAAILEGIHVIAVEREAEYIPLIEYRIDRARAATADSLF